MRDAGGLDARKDYSCLAGAAGGADMAMPGKRLCICGLWPLPERPEALGSCASPKKHLDWQMAAGGGVRWLSVLSFEADETETSVSHSGGARFEPSGMLKFVSVAAQSPAKGATARLKSIFTHDGFDEADNSHDNWYLMLLQVCSNVSTGLCHFAYWGQCYTSRTARCPPVVVQALVYLLPPQNLISSDSIPLSLQELVYLFNALEFSVLLQEAVLVVDEWLGLLRGLFHLLSHI